MTLCSDFKTSPRENLLYRKDFDIHENKAVGRPHFQFCMDTRFDTLAKADSEMIFWHKCLFFCQVCCWATVPYTHGAISVRQLSQYPRIFTCCSGRKMEIKISSGTPLGFQILLEFIENSWFLELSSLVPWKTPWKFMIPFAPSKHPNFYTHVEKDLKLSSLSFPGKSSQLVVNIANREKWLWSQANIK